MKETLTKMIDEGELVLSKDIKLLEEATQIAQSSAEDERFTFYLQYDPNLKHDLLEVIETAGAEVVADDTEGHVLTVSTNMQQLALIKRVDGVERVRSNEGSNPFLMEEVAETQAEAQTAPRFADGNMTADATVMSMADDGIAVANVGSCPPNITLPTAQEIAVETNVSGNITCPGAEQWFKFTIANGGYHTIYTTGSLDTVGTLYSDTGSLLKEVDDYAPCGKLNFRIHYPLITNYTYYVKVTANNNATGSYKLMVTKKDLVDSVHITGANENGVIILEKGKTYEMPMSVGYTFQVADGSTILQAPFGVRVSPSSADNKEVYWTFSSGDGIGKVLFDRNLPAGCEPYQKLTVTKEGTGHLYAHDWNEEGKVGYASVKVLTPYEKQLKESCGFSNEEIDLIQKLYDRVEAVFSSESTMLKAWKCARLLSEFSYDSFSFNDVAGSLTNQENRQTYFMNTLGYTENEYNTLKIALSDNHADGNTIDFTHLQYSLAARLAYSLDKDGWASNLGSQFKTGNWGIYSDEDISYLGGWLGDATLRNDGGTGEPVLKNDDYMADLDAENIYRLICQGYSSIDAINAYYLNMNSSNTRANIFLQYIPYSTVKQKIFYELIDAQLYMFMSNASSQGDIVMTQYWLSLINNEQYHFDEIKSKYPDTYDFLRSIEDRLDRLKHYEE